VAVTKYVYDGDTVLQEYDALGATQTEYTSTAQGYGDLLSAYDGSAAKYYEPDALGSTDALADQSQTVVDRWRYRAFGSATQTVGTDSTPFTWIGRLGYYADAETGLYQLGNGTRCYDPATAQFLSDDPVGFAGRDANLRRYSDNNPISNFDPSGLSSVNGSTFRAKTVIELDGDKPLPEGDPIHRVCSDELIELLTKLGLRGLGGSVLASLVLRIPCPLPENTRLQLEALLTLYRRKLSFLAIAALSFKLAECEGWPISRRPVVPFAVQCARILGSAKKQIPLLDDKQNLIRDKASAELKALVRSAFDVGLGCACTFLTLLKDEKAKGTPEQQQRLDAILDGYPGLYIQTMCANRLG
jgi:RHS repeat-associated protein